LKLLKKKINIEKIINQVKRNCNISDAKEDLKKLNPYFLKHAYIYERGEPKKNKDK